LSVHWRKYLNGHLSNLTATQISGKSWCLSCHRSQISEQAVL